MPTPAEQSFNTIVKDVYKATLKPLGYRKKGNNFYLPGEIGKIINLQKSMYYSKDHIKFTVNIGIFSPLYWKAYYNFFNKPVPAYPTEPECVLRRRIGNLKEVGDEWYEVTGERDTNALCRTQFDNLQQAVLPYLETMHSHEDLIKELTRNKNSGPVHTKVILLAELGLLDEAYKEYTEILSNDAYKRIRSAVMEQGLKYGFDKQ